VVSVSYFSVSTGDTKHGGGERVICDIAKWEGTA
jgi:hypothetical protein